MLALVLALHVAFCSSMETQPHRRDGDGAGDGPVVTEMVPESFVGLAGSVAELGDAVAALAESLGQIPVLWQDQLHWVTPGGQSSFEPHMPSLAESLEAQPNFPGEPVATAAAAEAHVPVEQFGVSEEIIDVDGEPDAEPVPGEPVAAEPISDSENLFPEFPDELFELWY